MTTEWADRQPPPYWDLLLKLAAARWHIDAEDITRQDRRRGEYLQARWSVMWVLRRRGLSYPHIGYLVDRDHSTVIWGVRAIEGSRRYLRNALALDLVLTEQYDRARREKVGA